MSHYTFVSALIFALVAVAHIVRLFKGWTVKIGPYSVPMSISWIGLIVAGLMAIWGFAQ